MSDLRALVSDNPVAVALTAAAVVASAAAALTLGGAASTQALLNDIALAVVLWVFAAGFWAGELADRL
ncbi:MAG: hypothetical protein ABEJ79_06610 [Halolamina sp.]